MKNSREIKMREAVQRITQAQQIFGQGLRNLRISSDELNADTLQGWSEHFIKLENHCMSTCENFLTFVRRNYDNT